jgi:hypothetical protein
MLFVDFFKNSRETLLRIARICSFSSPRFFGFALYTSSFAKMHKKSHTGLDLGFLAIIVLALVDQFIFQKSYRQANFELYQRREGAHSRT